MITFELVLFTLFIFIMVYALVDRVCKCAENRAMAKAYFASLSKSSISPAEAMAKLNAALNLKKGE